jgi:hypothetical protein
MPPDGWQETEANPARVDEWQPGRALCAVTGIRFDASDMDPRNGGKKSYAKLESDLGDDGPDPVAIVATPRGGAHYWTMPLGIGSHNGIMPGIDLKGGKPDGSGRGFVFLPPTVRFGVPYRYVQPVSFNGQADTVGGITRYYERCLAERASAGRSGGQETDADDLAEECRKAEAGQQRDALLRYVYELEKLGYRRPDIVQLCVDLDMENYDPKRPWRLKDFRGLLHAPGRIIGNATPAETAALEGIEPIQPGTLGKYEDTFWAAQPSLRHIFAWAMARYASPWAVLGEVLAEVICHTPPWVQLPPIGAASEDGDGNGSLNMLLALVGKSGAGKKEARDAARLAFRWHGLLGSIPDQVPRKPLGSGEGLAKCFGFARRVEGDDWETILRDPSAIVEIPEIDTYAAIESRKGSTLSPELRKLYSGEELGFQYSEGSKRVIIEPQTYRACIVAGVQPGRGDVILGATDGGFAQRWVWFPTLDARVELDPEEPDFAEGWKPPRAITEWDPEGPPLVMRRCETATREIRQAAVDRHKGKGDALSAHALFTQCKVAAGLALLERRVSISEQDWELARYVMKKSDQTREMVASELRAKRARANIARGRDEGERKAVADATAAETRVERNILAKMPWPEWISRSKLRNKFRPEDRELFDEILPRMVRDKKVMEKDVRYQSQTGQAYRRRK